MKWNSSRKADSLIVQYNAVATEICDEKVTTICILLIYYLKTQQLSGNVHLLAAERVVLLARPWAFDLPAILASHDLYCLARVNHAVRQCIYRVFSGQDFACDTADNGGIGMMSPWNLS